MDLYNKPRRSNKYIITQYIQFLLKLTSRISSFDQKTFKSDEINIVLIKKRYRQLSISVNIYLGRQKLLNIENMSDDEKLELVKRRLVIKK